MLQRRCVCGGSSGLAGSCSECEKKKLVGGQPLQTQLAINEPGDRYEQEADRIADQVLATPVSAAVSTAPPRIRRFSGQDNGRMAAVPASVDQVLASPGSPLDPALQQDMEQRFGHDFDRVRVHSDMAAAQSARDVNAKAYTVGHHIMFGAGQFAPGLLNGRRLIAHELSHVLQQSGPTTGLLQRAPDKEKDTEAKPSAKFVGCDKDRMPVVEGAIKEAEALAARAVKALEREYPLTYEDAAMRANFGSLASDQKSTVIERYKHVMTNLSGKTFTCAKDDKKTNEGNNVADLCGQAACPGSNITLFPIFGKETCPAGPVMLHEALHNAGACDDFNKGNRYPPANSENNAYSYEYFALDVTGGYKTPDLGKRKPTVPKVK
jgi:hypothetical protein